MSLLRIINRIRSQSSDTRYVSKHRNSWKNVVPYKGIVDRTALTQWQYNTRTGRTATPAQGYWINPCDVVYHSSSRRRSFSVARIRYEFKEVDTTTVLVRQTTEIWSIPGDNSWNRIQRAEVDQILTTDASKTIVTTTAIHADHEEDVVVDDITIHQQNTSRALIGRRWGQSYRWATTKEIIGDTKRRGESDFSISPNDDRSIISSRFRSVELRGLDAQLWNDDNLTVDKIMAILEPTLTVEYVFPSNVRKKDHRDFNAKSVTRYGDLLFGYIRDEVKMASGDSLQNLAMSERGLIIVSIPTKCALSYPDEGGNIVAKDIEPGTYHVHPAVHDTGSIYDKRLRTLSLLGRYRLQIEVSRFDYLTVMDINQDSTTDDEFDSHRIGAEVDVDTSIVTESDSLFDRLG